MESRSSIVNSRLLLYHISFQIYHSSRNHSRLVCLFKQTFLKQNTWNKKLQKKCFFLYASINMVTMLVLLNGNLNKFIMLCSLQKYTNLRDLWMFLDIIE